jgi:hypothetical protein
MALGASKNPMTPALLWFSSDQTKDVFWSSGRWHWNPVRTASIRNSNLIVSDVAITNSGKRLYGTVIISGINPDFSYLGSKFESIHSGQKLTPTDGSHRNPFSDSYFG